MRLVTMLSTALSLTISGATLGCNRESAGDDAALTIADSAGITIATNAADAAALRPVFSVHSEPRLRIGVQDGAQELMFSRIRGVVRLDDGRIAVANGQPVEIRVFKPRGEFATRLGGQGAGPGEFQSLSRLFAGAGDTLLAVNMPRFQLLRFSVASGYVGMSAIQRDSIDAHLLSMTAAEGTAEYLRDGSFVIAATSPSNGPSDGSQFPTGELFRRQTTEVWVSGDRSRSLVLGTIGDIQQMFIDIGGGRRTAEIPPSSRWGKHAIDARATRYCSAGNEIPEVRCIDDRGRRLIIRWAQADVPTPAEEIERWRAGVRAGAARPGSGTSAQVAERIISAMIIPPTRPPIGTVVIDSEGRILVSGPDLVAPEGGSRYRVFSPRGELLGFADLPRIGLAQMGPDYLLGVTRNDDGVEFVVMHDVTRAK
jgi:hypothetical protein